MFRLSISRIRELIKVATESGAAEVEIEERGVRIVVREEAASVMMQPSFSPMMPPHPGHAPPQVPAAPAPAPVAEKPDEEIETTYAGSVIRAPIVGAFYRKPSPDADSFVEVGMHISKGDTVCIIEAMKNMNEVESEVSGVVKEVLAHDGEGVSYDQPLFVVG